jgi:hypothetical protein
MAHPMRVDPFSEGKPPQAVRQDFAPVPAMSSRLRTDSWA